MRRFKAASRSGEASTTGAIFLRNSDDVNDPFVQEMTISTSKQVINDSSVGFVFTNTGTKAPPAPMSRFLYQEEGASAKQWEIPYRFFETVCKVVEVSDANNIQCGLKNDDAENYVAKFVFDEHVTVDTAKAMSDSINVHRTDSRSALRTSTDGAIQASKNIQQLSGTVKLLSQDEDALDNSIIEYQKKKEQTEADIVATREALDAAYAAWQAALKEVDEWEKKIESAKNDRDKLQQEIEALKKTQELLEEETTTYNDLVDSYEDTIATNQKLWNGYMESLNKLCPTKKEFIQEGDQALQEGDYEFTDYFKFYPIYNN